MKVKSTFYYLLFTILFGVLIYFGFKKLVASPIRVKINKGIVGQPHLINPLYADLNPVDKQIANLIFRGLVTQTKENETIGDLAESWEVSTDGKVYTVKLKPNLTWHNGEKLRADDVVFTYQLTQEEGYQSPAKDSFGGVTIKKIDDQTVKFILKEPFAPFLSRLTLGILPKHKLFEVSAKDLPKDEFNLHPLGAGNWKFAGLKLNPVTKKIASLALQSAISNQQFNNLIFHFYESEEDLATAFKLGEINTFATINPKFIEELNAWPNTQVNSQTLTGTTFALFFNLRNKEVLQNFDFRKALALAIDKEKLPGALVDGPIPPSSWAYSHEISKYTFDQESAKGLLSQFTDEQKTVSLKFCEKTFCQELAEEIAKNWQAVDIKVNLEELSKAGLAQTIKDRDFEILLLQQNSGSDPDQYSLWHSSQTEPPGQNITGFSNRRVDKFLTDARKTLNQDERKTAYFEAQKEITSELPAIFLVQPTLYTVSAKKLSFEGLNF